MIKKSVFLAVAVLLILSVLAIATFFPYRLCLAVTDDTGRDVLWKEVVAGDIVTVKFTHSVEKVEVTENYLVTKDSHLLLRNATYGSMGAGLPSDISDHIITRDGLFIVEDINRSFDRVNYITSSIPGHRLVLAGVEYRLFEMIGEEKPFFISLKRKSLADAFISRI